MKFSFWLGLLIVALSVEAAEAIDEPANPPRLNGELARQNSRATEPLEIGYYTYGAVGFSFASQLGAPGSEYVDNHAPSLRVTTDPFRFPEYSLGFIAKRKIALGWRSMLQLAYRKMEKTVTDQDITHRYQRTAYSLDFLESYTNQQGFVPYVGISWNLEELSFSPEMAIKEERRYTHFGLVGGWDILPYPASRWFVRTHFRWYPDTSLFYQGQRVSFPNLEFSPIQFVVRFN